MRSKHKDDLPYRTEILRGGQLPDGWTATENPDGTYAVSGPCPACFGDAYGPAISQLDEEVGDDSLLYIDGPGTRSREILAACACGNEHTKSGATSCGREWGVRVHTREAS
jgi:hypothetical protein